ncbi:MAG: NUDIX domain-containing protein [Janthinobacterium lividum]
MPSLLRHVLACTDARLPGGRLRLFLGTVPVGWVRPDVAEAATGQGRVSADGISLPDAAALGRTATVLAAQGRYRPRGEAFAIRSDGDGAVLGAIDRAALPVLGLRAHNAHLNGLVRRRDGLHLWVATRAAHKELGPGKLDHLVAGGIPFGLTARETLVKECAEEAGLPPALAARAVPVPSLAYATERPEGLRRETLHCFDLDVPEAFHPVPVDGEVAGFALWPMLRVMEALRETEDFLYDVALAVIDLALRTGHVPDKEVPALRAALAHCAA